MQVASSRRRQGVIAFVLVARLARACGAPSERQPCMEPSAGAEQPAAPAAAAPVAVPEREVVYGSGSPQLKGVLVYPGTPGKHPAVMVVHEWWGLNDYAR